MDNFMKRVAHVQKMLKAPKNQYNSFGKYSYRSCEDILEAAKPLCCDNGIVLTVNDSIEMIADRIYVKATATLHDAETDATISNTAYAREPEDKKGMDASQITGATSSYARKYALNGLFCIDDTKDADTDEYANQQNRQPRTVKKSQLVCKSCGCEIKDAKKLDGTVVPAQIVYDNCEGYCVKCYIAQKGN